ncbi:hypothetical protein EUGRSUZ_H03676 [Eucalyptus grandis]|uniref:Uncharacterized protein n=2 Tax=Eucalyptus grandis TaxID=71139 RepID=A0ACC3JUX0_EUCGR|nr:hypothetical protein EUGRSUZ_H03676 [Eucalyptus grandis]
MRHLHVFKCKKVVGIISIALKIAEHQLISRPSTADGRVLRQSQETVAISNAVLEESRATSFKALKNGTHLLIGRNFSITTKPSSGSPPAPTIADEFFSKSFLLVCVQNHERRRTSPIRDSTSSSSAAQEFHSASMQDGQRD